MALFLDVMSPKIHNKIDDILVMIDHGDMLLGLQRLQDQSAQTAFNALFSRRISIFDALTCVLVDRGTSFCAELMKRNLHNVGRQLLPIPAEASWGTRLNEQFHCYLCKSLERLLLLKDMDIRREQKVLLADVATVWNFAQHTVNILRHYQRFGVMPKFIGSLSESPHLSERTALMSLARQESKTFRARAFIFRALDSHHRHTVPFKSFSVSRKSIVLPSLPWMALRYCFKLGATKCIG